MVADSNMVLQMLASQDSGIHLVFNTDQFASSAHPNVVFLPPAHVLKLFEHASYDVRTVVAACQFILAHEMAHLYLRHHVSPARGSEHAFAASLTCIHVVLPQVTQTCVYCSLILQAEKKQRNFAHKMAWAHAAHIVSLLGRRIPAFITKSMPPALSADIYQQAASEIKALSWQHEFEADEVACALLARLRLPPEQWAAWLKMASAVQLRQAASWVTKIEEVSIAKCQSGKKVAAEEEPAAAALGHMGWPSVDEGLAQLKAALAKKDLPLLDQQCSLWAACLRRQALCDAADKDGTSQVGLVVGRCMCPPA